MRDMMEALERLVEDTILKFSSARPGCRYALDCNLDYGQVLVAAQESPPKLPLEAFFQEEAEELFSFGDWSFPDLAMEDTAIEAMWQERWSPHEDTIQEWFDSPDITFEAEVRHQRFLEGACRVAAILSKRLPDIVPPILVADHDEHVIEETSRLRWAFEGPPSENHGVLARGSWRSEDEVLNRLAFLHDGEFINHAVPASGPVPAVRGKGRWRLEGPVLTMTLLEVDWEKAENLLWKEVAYEVLSLTEQELVYREADGTVFRYHGVMT